MRQRGIAIQCRSDDTASKSRCAALGEAVARAPPLATFATVIAHVAAGDGWLFSARTLARHTPPGLVAKRLALTPLHDVRFEIVWHVNTDPATVDAFVARMQRALDLTAAR